MPLSAREVAARRKATCIKCLNGHHEQCTMPGKCEHYLCDDQGFQATLAAKRAEPERPTAVPATKRSSTVDGGPARGARVPEPERPRPQPDGLIWSSPPPKRRGQAVPTAAQIEALKQHPGEWARVKTYKTKGSATSAAGTCRSKKTAGEGIWEFTGAELEPPHLVGRAEHTGGLFVRYLGADEAEAEKTREEHP